MKVFYIVTLQSLKCSPLEVLRDRQVKVRCRTYKEIVVNVFGVEFSFSSKKLSQFPIFKVFPLKSSPQFPTFQSLKCSPLDDIRDKLVKVRRKIDTIIIINVFRVEFSFSSKKLSQFHIKDMK